MQELAFWAVDTSARAMEELRSESDGQSEASVAPSDQSVGYGTSGDDFDEEQVVACAGILDFPARNSTENTSDLGMYTDSGHL